MNRNQGEATLRPLSPTTCGLRITDTFNRGYDNTYFRQFRANPSELSFLAVHDLLYLHMKNIYYYQMELLSKYPAGTELNNGNIGELRSLLNEYCKYSQSERDCCLPHSQAKLSKTTNLCNSFLSLQIERFVLNANVSNMLDPVIISIETTIELSAVPWLVSSTACSPRTLQTLLKTEGSN